MTELPTIEKLETLCYRKNVAYAARRAMWAFAFWHGDQQDTAAVKKAIQVGFDFVGGSSFESSYLAKVVADAMDAADNASSQSRNDSDPSESPNAQYSAAVAAAEAARTVDAEADHIAAIAACGAETAHRAYFAEEVVVSVANLDYSAIGAARHVVNALNDLPDEPFDCGPRSSSLGPIWTGWKPKGWNESKLDFLYEK